MIGCAGRLALLLEVHGGKDEVPHAVIDELISGRLLTAGYSG
jgi:hypothetical protein